MAESMKCCSEKAGLAYFCYSFGCIHLRGVIVSRSHPACVRTVLDEYLVRAYSCQIFKTLASNRLGFPKQLRSGLRLYSNGYHLGTNPVPFSD